MDDEGWGRLLADVTGRHATDLSASELAEMRTVLVDAVAEWAMPVSERAAFLARFDTLVAELVRRREDLVTGLLERRVVELGDENCRLRAAVGLHRPERKFAWRCAGCGHSWPCGTARAAEGEGL